MQNLYSSKQNSIWKETNDSQQMGIFDEIIKAYCDKIERVVLNYIFIFDIN